jgi:hypothetical protein
MYDAGGAWFGRVVVFNLFCMFSRGNVFYGQANGMAFSSVGLGFCGLSGLEKQTLIPGTRVPWYRMQQ